MSTEVERARAGMVSILRRDSFLNEEACIDVANQILVIPGLCIKADDQSLPFSNIEIGRYFEYNIAQQDILRVGFVKVVEVTK